MEEVLDCNGVAGGEVAKDLADGSLYTLHDVYPAAVEKPPGEGEVAAVDFKVGTIIVLGIVAVVVVVFEGDGLLGGAGGEGDDRGEVGAAAKEVELNAG